MRPDGHDGRMTRRRLAILGATGSIGRQALDVVRAHPDRFEVVALTANSNADELEARTAEFGVGRSGLGPEAAEDLAGSVDADVVLNAVVGAAGLRASLAALSAGRTLALANKESLVVGGELCKQAAATHGATIVPVDSEHAALAQCLDGRPRDELARAVITASGGPFRTRNDLAGVTPSDALAHPTWSMGPKITVDSATMMNKALELIEAHHLFDLAYDEVDVVVHPQSIVHAMAEFVDGSVVMQAAWPDMRIPIAAALTHPDRIGPAPATVDLTEVGSLTFEPLDPSRFPAVPLGYDVGRKGGTYTAVFNAANEVAVEAFLDERIAFTDVVAIVADVVERHEGRAADSLDSVLDADAEGRAAARDLIVERGRVEAV